MKKSSVFVLVLGIFCVGSHLAQGAIPTLERTALIALYNSTNGDSWADKTGWKTPPLDADGFAMPGTEGGWYGVTVASDHVTQLVFLNNRLAGALPVQIGDFPSLNTLRIDSGSD